MYLKKGPRKLAKTPAILFSLVMALTLLTAAAQAAPAPGDLFTGANPAQTPGDLADGNGDMEIYVGPITTDSDALIGAIESDDVYEVDDQGGRNLIFSIVGNQLVAPDGRVLCTSEPPPGPAGVYTISATFTGGSTTPLFTVKGLHLWYGAVDVPDEGSSGWETAHSQRAYDVWQNQFYPGPKGKTDAIISATANLQEASPLRKLALMALVEGECGSSGLDPRPTPQ